MATIKIPTPLRAYTGGNAVIEVAGATVSAALQDLTAQHPDLRQHIFEGDQLRSFVNIFIGQEDVRYLDGLNTDIDAKSELRIIPSIAGGRDLPKVDQNALRANQAFIIGLLLVAFVADLPLLVAFVAAVMIIGAIYPPARLFVLIYQTVLLPTGLIKPDVIQDNPEPHRFALGLGGTFTAASALSLFAGLSPLGWALSLLVVGLAALNLFVGFCAGCFVYYQLNRLGVPYFDRAPI